MKVIHIEVNQAISMADALEKFAALVEQMRDLWGTPGVDGWDPYGRYSLDNCAKFLRRAVEDEVGRVRTQEEVQ